MRCAKCGTENLDRLRFCRKCGHALNVRGRPGGTAPYIGNKPGRSILFTVFSLFLFAVVIAIYYWFAKP